MPDAPLRSLVVVPCYNEADRLDPEAFLAFTAEHPDVRFLMVNDGSTDDTSSVIADLAGRSAGAIDHLDLSPNAGKAEAVRRGLLAALEPASDADPPPDLVGYWDADLATPLDQICDFARIFVQHPSVQMVLGSRVRLLGGHVQRRLRRHYLGRGFATLVSLMLGIPVYDTQCGAKLMRATPVLRDLLAAPFVSRWIFDVELIQRYLATTRTRDHIAATEIFHEFPLPIWRDVEGSKLRPYHFLQALGDLFKIRSARRR